MLNESRYGQQGGRPAGLTLAKGLGLGVTLIAIIFALFSFGSLFENIGADEIVVIQAPFSGELHWYKQPGVVGQWFGKVTSYPKRASYEFQTQVRFNDGGHGTMNGSVQWEMPVDDVNLSNLHMKFGSAEAIQKQLIEKVVNKSVYMTGPLMSSKESYAEKRNYLINYVEDQISNGVYKTLQKEVKVLDSLTGQEKSAIVVDILMTNGQPQRQEASALSEFGILTKNFAINSLPYDDDVEKQIKAQQQITMDVQTAIAEARKAEQRTLTVTQQGKASAEAAKWEQEVIKAKEVTAAQQKVEVAKLANDEAELYRQGMLKKADGDSTYRKKMMEADNALSQRLQAQVEIAKNNANALANMKVPIVPSTVFGGGNGNSAVTLLRPADHSGCQGRSD
jgi:hypothetical protein